MARALAARVASGPTRSMGLSKRLLNASFETDLDLADGDLQLGRLGQLQRLVVGVADPLPVVAEAVDAVVRERLVALDLPAPGRGRGRGSGVEVEMRVFSVYSFREGKVRRRQAFTEREAALEDLKTPIEADPDIVALVKKRLNFSDEEFEAVDWVAQRMRRFGA